MAVLRPRPPTGGGTSSTRKSGTTSGGTGGIGPFTYRKAGTAPRGTSSGTSATGGGEMGGRPRGTSTGVAKTGGGMFTGKKPAPPTTTRTLGARDVPGMIEGGRATNMPTRPAAGKLTGRANAITRGKGKKKGLRRIMAAPTAAKKKRPKPKR